MPPLTLSNLHFLIHPMFLGDATRVSDPDPMRQLSLDLVSTILGKSYAQRAATLESNEAMILFSHLKVDELRTRDDAYIEFQKTFLRAMDTILDQRLIFVPDDYDIFDDFRVVGNLTSELRNRGMRVGKKTRGIAYGENLKACVAGAATNLQEGFDLKTPTTVEAMLTDAFVWWPQADEPERNAVRSYFKSLGLLLKED